jgi:uncharacterized damage-inducible protein DinB
MNAAVFRHFYNYHFAQNRKIWDTLVSQISYDQFTQHVGYSHDSIRNQIVHLIEADEVWFSELKDTAPSKPLPPAAADDREMIRAHWDSIEQMMRSYLADLQDDMLFKQPIVEPDDDKDLYVWQVLLHVANHGTDHRAQILRFFHDLGVKTEYQDYIFYAYGHPVT